jgi:hypothetical protein
LLAAGHRKDEQKKSYMTTDNDGFVHAMPL